MKKIKCPEQLTAILALVVLALAVELSLGDSISWSGLAFLDWLGPLEAVAQVMAEPLEWRVSQVFILFCFE